jgi:hypothetical protein
LIEFKVMINKFISSVIIILNVLFFIPKSVEIVINGGGPFGFGLLLLPFTFFIHIFFITSLMIFFKKFQANKVLIWLNVIGLLICGVFLGYSLRSIGY